MRASSSTDERVVAAHLAVDRARADHAVIRAHVDQRLADSRHRMAATRRLLEDSRVAVAQLRRATTPSGAESRRW